MLPHSSRAVISNYVPPILPNTDWVDRIEAYGCSLRTFRAFQPQSHADLLEAMMPFAEAECAGPEWLLQEREILGRSFLQSEARVFGLFARDVPIALLGQQAVLDPFFPLREGRRAFGGSSIYGELNLNSQLVSGRSWGVAASATPGFVLGHENSNRIAADLYFQEGYVKAGVGRAELVFGRISQRFGEAKNGNLLLGGASKPLDLLKVAIRPHWVKPLSFLGPIALETWVSNDGSKLGRENARLWGFQFGMRPFTFFEWGFLNLMHFGGTGAPSLEFSDYLAMLWASNHPEIRSKRHQSFATHLAFWGPQQKVKLYNQLLFGNLGRLENWFSRDVSWLVGLWFPKVGDGEIRLEWVRTQNTAYSHSQWVQGWSYEGGPLGHPLGNAGQGIYLDFSLPLLNRWRPEVGLSFEKRNDQELFNSESETRMSASLGAMKRIENIEWDLQLKLQRIQNREYRIREVEWQGGFFSYLRYSFL